MAEAKVGVVRSSIDELRTPILAAFRFEDDDGVSAPLDALDRRLDGALRRLLERGDFRGRKDETAVLYGATSAGPDRVVLVGLGKKSKFSAQSLRRGVGLAVRQAERLRVRDIALVLHGLEVGTEADAETLAAAAVEAGIMAAWDWRDLKTSSDEPPPVNVAEITLLALDEREEAICRRAAARGEVLGRAANFARDLAIRPGNIATPTFLAETARNLGERYGLTTTVLDRAAMQREGMKALLAVAQGSEEEPRFIVLERRSGKGKPVVIIGKGVTFDSGGISIKPAERMEEMKFDMSGAAGVLGAMQDISELDPAIDVVALVPATENLPSGRAVKPGDVIGSLLGKTIEVINTDAEGRLILADALAWARRYEPAAMVNAATLTGAIGIALGHHAIGVMGNNDALIEEVRAAGQRSGERCWPLPLWDEYRAQLDSPVADLKNTGGRPGGSITAGWFLREFAGEVPWVHLDIAATAYRDEPAAPYLRKGPTGVPARLLIEWVQSRVPA